jgi:hypothetical protein
MRRLALGICLSLLLNCTGPVLAQKSIDKNQINKRISDLRERLKEYQQSMQTRKPVVEEAQLEKISDEFEARDDVAVTVLYRDPVLSQTSPSGTDMEILEEAHLEEIKNKDDYESDTNFERLEELQRREQLYEKLRAKVRNATRSSQAQAKDINRLVALIK